MLTPILFILTAVLLIAIVYGIWAYWNSISQRSPEEEAFDKRVATLNQRQAYRLSDKQLSKKMSEDDAWQIMVNQGRRSTQRRQERYNGELMRRQGDRKRRP